MTPVGGIAEVGHDAKAGLFVRVVSPDGKIISSYAHLNVANVTNGQQVSPGQIVAMSGASGDATGPHVHWRLKVDGKDVDPLSYHPQGDHAVAPPPGAQQAEAAPGLAPSAQPPQAQPPVTVMGPSLYDMAGVADAAESDRYRIRSGLANEAQDRLQAIVSARRLKGLEATDRLYATFGTRVLTGGVDTQTVVNTLAKAGYDGPTIAEALNNVHSTVADSAGLQTARLSINANDPSTAKRVFDLETEGRVNGYSEDYERRVGQLVVDGTISGDDGARMVGSAVSRTEQQQAASRAQQSFAEAHPPAQPGQIIRKASQVRAGIDQYATVATSRAAALLGRSLTKGEGARQKQLIKDIVTNHLIDFPGDYAGAEQAARDYVAKVLAGLAAKRGLAVTSTSSPAPSGSANPRR
jgi:hypothetical protein